MFVNSGTPQNFRSAGPPRPIFFKLWKLICVQLSTCHLLPSFTQAAKLLQVHKCQSRNRETWDCVHSSWRYWLPNCAKLSLSYKLLMACILYTTEVESSLCSLHTSCWAELKDRFQCTKLSKLGSSRRVSSQVTWEGARYKCEQIKSTLCLVCFSAIDAPNLAKYQDYEGF